MTRAHARYGHSRHYEDNTSSRWSTDLVGSGRVVKSGSISALCSTELNCAILDLTFDRPIIVMAGRVQPVRVIPTAALKALVIEFDRINAANVG